MIKHEGNKWVLYTKDGTKKLGEHDSKSDAEAQERAIEASKHRAASNVEEFRALLYATAARSLESGGEHPFAYCMENIIPAMEREGKGPEDPEAFCAWWKMEHAQVKEIRQLHLHGCASKATVKTENGVEYIVVPVVALMEGVIHAVNAESPEFVPLSTLQKAAASWNGKPVTLGHPVRNGKQCSANDPEILEAHGIGMIRNSRVEGRKLLQEAWVEKQRVLKLRPDMHDRLLDAKHEEVSVGAFVMTDRLAGNYNGKPYKQSWLSTDGDHLAFLPGGRGACSLEMGCGAHRAASYFVTAEALLPLSPLVLTVTSLQAQSLEERIQAVNVAVSEKWRVKDVIQPAFGAYAQQVFDDHVIVRQGEETWSMPYTMKDGKVVLGEATKVRLEWVAAKAKYEDCPACKGSGNANGNPCEACDGEGELKVAAGARHSSSDMDMIQTIHDHAMALGAKCDRQNYKWLSNQSNSSNSKKNIRNEGGKWVLYSKDGLRRLTTHDTEAEAVARERAIEAAQLRRDRELQGVAS